MSDKFKQLIDMFSKLPGIGPRQATRLVLSMLNWSDSRLQDFSSAISDLKTTTIFCSMCYNISDTELCTICSSNKREKGKIAVIERITDLTSMEKTGVFDGVYHILGGTINPAEGVLPEHLRIEHLKARITELSKNTNNIEIIFALSPTTSGDTTILYLKEIFKDQNVKLTSLARGLQSGATLEYTDESTLAYALKNRL